MPKDGDLSEFNRVYKITLKLPSQPITLAAAIFKNIDEVSFCLLVLLDNRFNLIFFGCKFLDFHMCMKLSRDEKYMGYAIISNRDTLKINEDGEDKLQFYRQSQAYPRFNFGRQLRREELAELLKYQGNEKYMLPYIQSVLPKYGLHDKHIRNVLPRDMNSSTNMVNIIVEKLRVVWIKSNFKLTNNELLEYVSNPTFLFECKLEYEKKNKRVY